MKTMRTLLRLQSDMGLHCFAPYVLTNRPILEKCFHEEQNGMTNSADPDQTAPSLGVVRYWSASSDQANLYENLVNEPVVRGHVFRVSYQVRHKAGCIATEIGLTLEISELGRRGIVIFM